MAEQRTNIDREDVLSSIRRLISEEPPRPRRPEVLVLTPALRVVEGSAPPREPRSVKAQTADFDTWPAGLPFREILQSGPVRLADFALPGDQASARPSQDNRGAPSAEASPRQAALAQPSQALEPEMPAEEDIAAFFSTRPHGTMSLEERIAGLQAAIAQTGAQFEPDGTEGYDAFSPEPQRRSEDARRTAVIDEVPPQARFTAARPQGRIEDAVELPGDAISASHGHAAHAQQDQYSGQAFPEAAPHDAPHQGHEPQYEDALLDEDSLRGIIADLVRQELRGELGEQITRNMRGLIRRELNRALTLRDLRRD